MTDTSGHHRKQKIAVVGDYGVGKTSLVTRLVKNEFMTEYCPTIGSIYLTYMIDGMIYQVWDTAGGEKFRSLIPLYTKDCFCCILCVETSDDHVLDRLDYWVRYLNDQGVDTSRIIFCGTKADLGKPTNDNDVIFHCKTSARTGQGFDYLIDCIRQVRDASNRQTTVEIDDANAKKKKCC